MAPQPPRTVGLGCMRLSTAPDRDDEQSIAVIHAALDAGATLLDTADAYCHDETDVGHNERLVARALATWKGDVSGVEVATKGGLTRPGGRWVADGRAKHLVAACEASLQALGHDALDLYQLHAPDTGRPFATSVRALARLEREGLVRRVGLCNVSVAQLRQASELVEVVAVQVELSPLRIDALRGGVVGYCARESIQLIAHSPFGGPRHYPRLSREPALVAIAEELAVSPYEVALAWLCSLGVHAVPIPGATRPESAASAVGAQRLELSIEHRLRLDESFLPVGAEVPRPGQAAAGARGRAREATTGEVVVVMGYPGAGKSTVAAPLVEAGYERFNRDERGGTLASLASALDTALESGARRAVLDNTYPSRSSRNTVVEVARRHGLPVRCVWLTTALEDAQINTVRRMLDRHGCLLTPEEMRAARDDPTAIPPRAHFDYRRAFEPPELDEGFTAIDEVPFADDGRAGRPACAIIVDHDELLDADSLSLLSNRRGVLRRYAEEGWLVAVTAWWPDLDDEEEAGRRESDLARLLGIGIDLECCTHGAGPPVCWCRKPLPGLGVTLIDRHELDPAASLIVVSSAADRTVASRLNVPTVEPDELF